MKGLWLVRKPLQAEIYGRTTIVQHLVRQIDAYSPVFHTPLKFLPLAIWDGVCLRHGGGKRLSLTQMILLTHLKGGFAKKKLTLSAIFSRFARKI